MTRIFMSLFTNGSFMQSLRLLERALDTAVLRRKVLANNIANVDVPHFKRSELSFEAEIKRAVDAKKELSAQPPLRAIHPLHIVKRSAPAMEGVMPRIHIDYNSTMRNDGNNVDIEDEANKLVRNQLQYNLLVDRLTGTFRHLNTLIRSA